MGFGGGGLWERGGGGGECAVVGNSVIIAENEAWKAWKETRSSGALAGGELLAQKGRRAIRGASLSGSHLRSLSFLLLNHHLLICNTACCPSLLSRLQQINPVSVSQSYCSRSHFHYYFEPGAA